MKFGIIGTNFVSDFFMSGAKQEERCEVVAVCSRKIDSANKFADKYNIKYRFDDYKKMVDLKIIDAVYIAVPNALHFEIASYFLKNKIPTYLEKPLASNYNEVLSLIELARENNTYLHEGLIPLYNPNFIKLKNKLDTIGKIHQVVLNFSKYSSRYDAYLANENPTTFQSELANGAIMDLGVYIIAVCIALFGKPREIFSASNLLDTKADISGSSTFVYDDFIATLMYSKASDTNALCEINGELGSILIATPSTFKEFIIKDRLTKKEETINESDKDMFYYMIKTMIDSVLNNEIENKLCPHETSLMIHEALTICRKKAKVIFPQDN